MNKRAAAVGLISAALPRRLRGTTPHPGEGQNPLKMKHLPGESPPVPLPAALGAPGSTLSSRPHTKGANGDQERPWLFSWAFHQWGCLVVYVDLCFSPSRCEWVSCLRSLLQNYSPFWVASGLLYNSSSLFA